MYEVIERFRDSKTNHVYSVGDKYPAKGKATKERIATLIGFDNSYQTPFIVEVPEPEPPKAEAPEVETPEPKPPKEKPKNNKPKSKTKAKE